MRWMFLALAAGCAPVIGPAIDASVSDETDDAALTDSPFVLDSGVEAACGDPTWPADAATPDASLLVPIRTCTTDDDCTPPTQTGCCYGPRYSVHLVSRGCDDTGQCAYSVQAEDCPEAGAPCLGSCSVKTGLCVFSTCE